MLGASVFVHMRERCAIKRKSGCFRFAHPADAYPEHSTSPGKKQIPKHEGMKNKQKHLRDAMKKPFPQLDYDEKELWSHIHLANAKEQAGIPTDRQTALWTNGRTGRQARQTDLSLSSCFPCVSIIRFHIMYRTVAIMADKNSNRKNRSRSPCPRPLDRLPQLK